MAIDTYQDMLKERGYQIVQSDALPPPFMPGLIINTRTPLVTGTKQVGAATVELQLQRVVGCDLFREVLDAADEVARG